MSETEPVLEPVPVTKDVPVVNGNGDIDSPPPEPELRNGLNKSEMEVSNGVDDSFVNGDNIADGEPGPVNGDCTGHDEEADLMGEDELPPPPEIVPDLPPPPPQECETQDLMCDNDTFESSVDPVIESSVDQMESNVDQVPEDIGEVECVDENEDLMNVSDSEAQQEEIVEQNVEVPKQQEEVSEEELVSDGGLQDEVEVEIQNNQQNEEVEQGQLIDLGEPEKEEEIPAAPVEPSAPLVDLSEPVEPELPPEPKEQPVEEVIAEPEEVSSVNQEPVSEVPETLPEPEPVVEPESVPEPVEEPVSVPVVEQVVEAPQEPEREPSPVPEPTPVVPQEPEVPVEEPTVEEPQQQVEETVPQVAYSEPAIVVDNKPAEEEAEVPPPPPPPLVDETPPPPPPLDENIPLRRVSGSSTPNKQSPSKEIESPLAISTPMNVAVVSPQPEPVAVGQEIEQQPEPVPVPVKTEPLAPPPQSPHPVAVVAPQVVSEEVSPPASSSPDSPTATSEQAPSEGEKIEAEPVVSPQVSQKINKKNFKNKIKFGVDLVEASLKQLHFLYNVNRNPGLYEEWLFKKAIRRYEAFWLPLAAEHKKESLAAPLDIEWVWHCHMLAPVRYDADSKSIAGLVVEHKLMSEKDRTKSLEKSRKYWTAKYPNEPFEIDLVYKEKVVEETPVVEEPKQAEETPVQINEPKETENKEAEGEVAKEAEAEVVDKPAESSATEPAPAESSPPTEAPAEATPAAPESAPAPAPTPAPEPEIQAVPEEDYEQKSSYNIFGAIARQRVFFYQVSLPHFHDKHFLKTAQKRYQRFLFLKHQNPTEMIVPCYDIDVMWHSHQLHPSVYKHDTVKVLGQILRHDDSVNDRSSGSVLMKANQKTRDLWKEHFGDTFTNFGAMFRGEPPVLCERMSMIEPAETYAFSTKKATVNLDKVQVEGLPEEINKYSVKLAYGGYDDQEGPLIKQFKGNKKKIEFENTKKGLAHFVFDTKEYDRLKINMSQQIGFACTGHNEEIGAQILSMMPVVENIPKDKSDPSALTETVKIDIDEEQNMKATFSATIEPPKQGPTMLYMNPGNYESRFCIMPEQIVQMWGPIPLPRLPSGRDNHCIVASHKFVNHTGETTFTCRVIHSLPLMMSAIQVFYHSRMAAVAHLVGSDQIPQASQLSDSKKIFSLNPADGQRAVLIKNQQGDWGLLRGQWTGFRKHQPAVAATKGKKAKKEVPWNPGTLSVSFYRCATGAWQHITLPYLQENFKFTIQDANIDLRTGSVEINSEANEVAENLALGFSVALLHVMCQPRYKPPPPPEPIPVTVEPPPPSPEAKEAPKEEEQKEKPKEETPATQEGAEGEAQPAEGDAAAAEKPSTEEEKPKEEPKEAPKEQPKTPKSPAKSEPPTPSKKVKEVPPIPTFELGLVLAAGYNIEVATNDNIKKQFGANACAGCSALGFDVGVGMVGEVAADTAAEAETLEVVDNAGDEGADAGDHGDDGNSPDHADMLEMDAGGMDGMGDMGDAGAASCAAF